VASPWSGPVGFNIPSDGLSLAGFQVIMYGRFWVITEVIPLLVLTVEVLGLLGFYSCHKAEVG
jgi:hypothetical protein